MKGTQMKDFTKEELLTMIDERNLKIIKVSTVQQPGFEQTSLIAENDELKLKHCIDLFELTVLSQEHMILSHDEIKFVNKEGYLK